MAAAGPPWLVSSFRFRARLGFSIPSLLSGQRGITPAFWIRRSSSERRRDFNPHEQRAAQHTLWKGLTSPACASSAIAPRLPDADHPFGASGQTGDLPVPAQGASVHARVYDHAGPFGYLR
jgi:hypothetical protein